MTPLIDRNQCAALVLTCSDFRFKSTERAFAEAAGLTDDYDLIARPGSSRLLVQPRTPAARDTLLDEIRLLWTVHQFTRVLLVNHASCRAYDDLAGTEEEVAVHADHLRRAVPVIEATFSGVNAEPYFVEHAGGRLNVTKVAMIESGAP